jgi:hypothetical protein
MQEDSGKARSRITARHKMVFFMIVLLSDVLDVGFTYIDAKDPEILQLFRNFFKKISAYAFPTDPNRLIFSMTARLI